MLKKFRTRSTGQECKNLNVCVGERVEDCNMVGRAFSWGVSLTPGNELPSVCVYVCGIKKMAHRIHPQTPATVNKNISMTSI
jgi:hypothetical protein